MASIRRRIEVLEAAHRRTPRRIIVYALPDDTPGLVPLYPGLAWGVSERDSVFLKDDESRSAYQIDLGRLTTEQTRQFCDDLSAVMTTYDSFEDLPTGVQDEMIAYIRAGEIGYTALAEEFGPALARHAFERAGKAIP